MLVEPASSPPLRPTSIPRIFVEDEDGSDVLSNDGTAIPDDAAHDDANGSAQPQRPLANSQLPTNTLSGWSHSVDLDVEAQITSANRLRRWDRVRRSSIGAHDGMQSAQRINAMFTSDRPQLAIQQQSMHRRHSLAESQANEVPGILDSSPLRRPFDIPDTRAYMISSEPQDTTKVADVRAAQERRFVQTPRPPVLERQISNNVREPERWNLRELLSVPASNSRPNLRPFFEWSISDSQHARRQSVQPSVIPQLNGEVLSPAGMAVASPILDQGAHLLDFFDRQLKSNLPYQSVFSKPSLPSSSQLYEQTSTKTLDDIVALLEAEHKRVTPDACTEPDPSRDINPDALLHDRKVELFINVHALAQCFVKQNDQHAEVFRKLWGIVYDICNLPGKSVNNSMPQSDRKH